MDVVCVSALVSYQGMCFVGFGSVNCHRGAPPRGGLGSWGGVGGGKHG